MNRKFVLTDLQSLKFNILKVVFSIMVVYGHANIVTTNNFTMKIDVPGWLDIIKYSISGIICGCAVNGFFLISSILLYRKPFNWKNNAKKKIKTLLVPYFVISMIIVAFCLFFEKMPITRNFFGKYYALSEYGLTEWLHAFGIGSACPLNGPLWFLRNLFILNILSVLIKKAIDKFPKLYLFFVILFAVFSNKNFFYLIYPINLLFWSLGYYVIKYNINIDGFANNKAFLIVLFICGFSIKFYANYLSNAQFYVENFSDIFSTLSEIILIYSLINTTTNNFLIDYLYPYNFCIYIFHYLPLKFILRFFIVYLPTNPALIFVEYLIIPAIVIIVIVAISKLLKKYLPKTYSLITGSRN